MDKRSTSQPLPFGSTRKSCLNEWLSQTGRKLIEYNGLRYDDFAEGEFECKWQLTAKELAHVDGNDKWHIPHFCSLGEWASNITDILTDDRFDDLSFIHLPDQEFLFRYFTRLLLVTSEMLTDFVDLLKLITNATTPRKDISPNVNKLFRFINNVNKHKVNNVHRCNNHLPFWFSDAGINNFSNPLDLDHFNIDNPDGIVMPQLILLIQTVIDGYSAVDTALTDGVLKKLVANHGRFDWSD
jgi:hypothetical protein